MDIRRPRRAAVLAVAGAWMATSALGGVALAVVDDEDAASGGAAPASLLVPDAASVALPVGDLERAALGAAVPDLPARPAGEVGGGQGLGVGTAAAPVAAAPVAPLGELVVPDVAVRAARGLTGEQVAALSAADGVDAVLVADAGDVAVAGRSARLLAVDPSSFRTLTPQVTAEADELWGVVARGDLVLTYEAVEARGVALGQTTPVARASGGERPSRVGGVAVLGLPGVDGIVAGATGQDLGLAPRGAAFVVAPDVPQERLARLVDGALADAGGAEPEVEVLRPAPSASALPTRPAPAGQPRTYLELYQASAPRCPNLSWTVLAAIGQIESGHGRNMGPSSAGALGPMQFMPATWAAYGVDGDRDGRADVMNPFDAVPAAADYLCAAGASRGSAGLYSAVFAYNHADWYVRKVLALAEAYAAQG